MALAGSCRATLNRSWLCLTSAGVTSVGVTSFGANLGTRTKSTQICEPIQSESSIISSAAKPLADVVEDADVIERRVERVEKMPEDGPQHVVHGFQEDVEGNSEGKFQPIDMASLAPGLAPPIAGPGKSKKWCELNYENLYDMINRARGNVWLVDVREQTEVQKAGMIPQSINIPLSTLKRALLQDSDDFFSQYGIPKPGKSDEYLIFYSLNHVKGVTALEIAHRLGFRKARQYAGGYEDWIAKQMQQMDAQALAKEL